MKNKNLKELAKKHSFIEVFFKTVGVPIILVVLAAVIGVGFYLNKDLMLTILKYILYVFAGIVALTASGVALLGVMTLFSFFKARFKSYLNVRYLPVSVEEIERLNIHTIGGYFKYIEEFLEMNYINYLWFFTLSVDKEDVDKEKFKKTSTIIPKFICKEIITTIGEYYSKNNAFISIVALKNADDNMNCAICQAAWKNTTVFKNIKKILCTRYNCPYNLVEVWEKEHRF